MLNVSAGYRGTTDLRTATIPPVLTANSERRTAALILFVPRERAFGPRADGLIPSRRYIVVALVESLS